MKNYSRKMIEILEKPMIECADFTHFVNELTDDEIPETLTSRLLQHSEECRCCESLLSEHLFLKSVASSLKLPPMPEDARRRIHTKLNSVLGLNLPA